MRGLLRLARISPHHRRSVLNRRLVRVLGLFRRIDNIKVVLVLPICIRIFSRMQDLFLLQLLLQHYLCLRLIGVGASILQCLRIAPGCFVIMLEIISGSRGTPVVLRRLITYDLLLELENVA